MAKDPAINWYFDNWAGGTIIMSRHLKGCYIDLLQAQFHNGHLSLEEIKIVLGADFSAWSALSKKFAVDETGKYYNERLDHEITKRQKFIIKQSENGSKGGRPKKPKENPNINPNKSLYGIEIETDISLGKSENLFFELTTSEIQNTIEYVDRVAQKKHSPEKITSLWQSFKIQYSAEYYPGRNKVIQHFRDWLKKQPKVSSEASTQRVRNQL